MGAHRFTHATGAFIATYGNANEKLAFGSSEVDAEEIFRRIFVAGTECMHRAPATVVVRYIAEKLGNGKNKNPAALRKVVELPFILF